MPQVVPASCDGSPTSFPAEFARLPGRLADSELAPWIQSSHNGSVARFCGDGGRNSWICFGPKPRPHSQTLWSPFLVCCMHLGTSLGSWRAPNKAVLHCDICRIQDNVGNLGQAGRRHQAGALGREHIDGLLSSCPQDARNATSRGKSLHMPRPRNHISKNIT